MLQLALINVKEKTGDELVENLISHFPIIVEYFVKSIVWLGVFVFFLLFILLILVFFL